MSRSPRVSYPGAFYHIISRGIDGTNLFNDSEEFTLYLELLKKFSDLKNVTIHAYTLLNTHSHMIVLNPLDNISSFMGALNTSYAVKVNRRRGRKGHLFADRFQSIIVDSNKYLVTLSRYVHINSVNAGLVKKPEDYEWSSCKYFIEDKSPPDFLDTDLTLGFFDYDRKKYYNFVMEGINRGDVLPTITKLSGVECYGNLSFAKKTIQKFERRRKNSINRKRRWLDKRKPVRYSNVIAIVLSNIDEKLTLKNLAQRRDYKSANIKQILSYTLVKYSNLGTREIARLLGYRNKSAISMHLKKMYSCKIESNNLMKRIMKEIENDF